MKNNDWPISFSTIRLDVTMAEPEDIPELISLESLPENTQHIDQWSHEQFYSALQDENFAVYRVTEKPNYSMSGLLILQSTSVQGTIKLKRVVVSKKRNGFGKELLTTVLTDLFNDKICNRVILYVKPDNNAAIDLYNGLSFSESNVVSEQLPGYRTMFIDRSSWGN